MSYQPSYISGDWKAICQVCGRIFKGSQLARRWDGIYVCKDDFEVKHPQLSVRGVRDDQRVPFVLPDSVDTVASQEVPGPGNIRSNSGDGSVDIVSSLPTVSYNGQRVFLSTDNVLLISNSSNWFYVNGVVYG